MPRTPVVVTIADFRARFPEFAATDDGHIEFAIEEALLIHSIRKLATLYCAAHVLSFRLTAISGRRRQRWRNHDGNGAVGKQAGWAVAGDVQYAQRHG